MRLLGIAVVLAVLPGAAADQRQALLQADRDFCQAVVEKGLEGWLFWFAEDGKMFPDGAGIVTGKAAIRERMAPIFARPEYSIRWKALGADISGASDFGYTYGTSVIKSADKDGKPVTRYGKYVTVWKKQADGTWRVVADMGNTAPPPK